MLPVEFKKRLRRGEVVVGPSITEFYSPAIAKLFGKVGFDWLHVELEQILIDEQQLYNFMSAGDSVGIPTIVKLPELSRNFVCRTLDGGAAGVRLPWTETRHQVEELVAWAKYPPQGKRAFWTGANTDYEPRPFSEYAPLANSNTVVMAHVETKRGVMNSDQICSVKGLDVAIIGPYDLSISLGVPEKWENPKFLQAARSIVRACESHRVVPGMTCSTVEQARKWISMGFRCIDYSSDWHMLHEKARSELTEVRKLSS